MFIWYIAHDIHNEEGQGRRYVMVYGMVWYCRVLYDLGCVKAWFDLVWYVVLAIGGVMW
jgi:hypothetical protein